MATIAKFYCHDAASPNTGTLPSGVLKVTGTSNAGFGDAAGARTARDATDVIGAANPDIESSFSSSGVGTQEAFGHRRFVSRPLAAQTIPFSGTWTFSYARSESNLNHNQSVRCCVYAWRPSTGAIVGTSAQVSVFTGTEPTAAGTEQAESVTSAAGTDLTIADGDILVFDITSVYTQAMSTVYTEQFAYDGTTEASTTTCASFVTPPSALTLQASGSTTNQALTATVATSPTIVRQTGKRVTANVATVPSFVRRTAKSITASVAGAASATKQTTRTITGTVAATANVLAQRVFLKAITATVGSAASVVRQTGKIVTASVGATGTIAKRVTKTLSATVVTVPSLLAPKTILRALTASVANTASVVRRVGKPLTATVVTVPSVVKRVGKSVTATVVSVPSITRQTAKNITAAVATVPSVVKRVGKTISASVAGVASIARSFISGGGALFNQALTATVGSSASIVRRTGKIVTATVVTVPSVTKRISKTLSATVPVAATITALRVVLVTLTAVAGVTGSVVRRVGTSLTATVGVTASFTKRTAKSLTASVTSAGNLIATFVSGAMVGLGEGVGRLISWASMVAGGRSGEGKGDTTDADTDSSAGGIGE